LAKRGSVILENKPYLIHGALFFIFFSFIVFSNEIKATKFVKKHWFYKRSLKSKLSSVFYILGFLFLLVSLLDIKGNEKKTLTYLPEQKVIVLIDCSLSMRSTDVFPSRFERSINFIRQFMRKGIGSKFSLMAFSDRSEVLIPFTDDLSIIESRLDLL
jgi:Ca-activated chloride channel family protein